MERMEICRHIDDGANFYLRLLGDAKHMEYMDNGYYSIIRPKSGQTEGTSLFNIRLEHLSEDELKQKINEIKELNIKQNELYDSIDSLELKNKLYNNYVISICKMTYWKFRKWRKDYIKNNK